MSNQDWNKNVELWGILQKRIHELKIGIIGFMDSDICSNRESKIFDFYGINEKSFLNGREVQLIN